MLKIGGILKAKMEDKDLQQKDLARLLKRDARSISNYCCDINFPDLDTLSQICNILDIDLNDIMQIEANGNHNLLLQDHREMKLMKSYRSMPEAKKNDFLNCMMILTTLIDHEQNEK